MRLVMRSERRATGPGSCSLVEGIAIDPVKLLRSRVPLNYDYDEEADVLYMSLGAPRPAVGVELGGGAVLMIDDTTDEIVGLTVLGVRRQLERALADDGAPAHLSR